MKKSTFWELWSEQLPAVFPKKEAIATLQDYWGLSYSPTYRRIRGGQFPNLVADISFMYHQFGIGFDMNRGFFFDQEKFQQIRSENEKQMAKQFKLSK